MSRRRNPRGFALRGARVLITGAGSGIGRLMALEAARRGAAEVVLWDLSEERATAVAGEITSSGGSASTAVVDVSDRAAVAEAAERTGAIDVLINNAGVVTGTDLLDATDEQIQRTFDVNTLALYWTTRAFLPGLRDRDRGVVVNIGSAAGLYGIAKQTDYSGSKFAAFGFTESLRNELRARGSRVSTLIVAPFYIDTGMFEGVTTKFPPPAADPARGGGHAAHPGRPRGGGGAADHAAPGAIHARRTRPAGADVRPRHGVLRGQPLDGPLRRASAARRRRVPSTRLIATRATTTDLALDAPIPRRGVGHRLHARVLGR